MRRAFSVLANDWIDVPDRARSVAEPAEKHDAMLAQALDGMRAQIARLEEVITKYEVRDRDEAAAAAEAIKAKDAALSKLGEVTARLARLEGELSGARAEIATMKNKPEPKIVVQAPAAPAQKDNLPAIIKAIQQELQRGNAEPITGVRVIDRDANGFISNFTFTRRA